MTGAVGATAFGPRGWSEGVVDITVRNVTGTLFLRGEVVQLDTARVDAETLNFKFGDPASAYCNVLAPQAGAAGITGRFPIFGVLLEDLAADGGVAGAGGIGKCRVLGKARVKAFNSLAGAQNAAAGDECVVTTTRGVDADQADLGRVVARLEPVGTIALGDAGPGTLVDCFFDGVTCRIR